MQNYVGDGTGFPDPAQRRSPRDSDNDLDEVEKLVPELIGDRPEDDPWYIKGIRLRDASDSARK